MARRAVCDRTGFYYDFDLPGGARFSDEDLGRIEARMRGIVAENQPFIRDEINFDEGLELFSAQPYKLEIIERARETVGELDEDLAADAAGGGGGVSTYRNTDVFVDLCRGPHVPSTGRLGYFKLMRVAGAHRMGICRSAGRPS